MLSDQPSILREDLDGLVLNLKAMGIPNVVDISWIDKPKKEKWKSALLNLRKLKAIDNNNDITDLGQKMAKIPLEPEISRLLISSYNFDCPYEMSIIVSFFENTNVFI